MNGYRFDLTCPGCGGELVHVANGSRRPWQQAAMARCQGCKREVLINVVVSFATAGTLEDGQRRRAAINAEHDKAVKRSEAALAGVA